MLADQGMAPGGCEQWLGSGYFLKVDSPQDLLVSLLRGVGGENLERAPSCQPDPLELLFTELGKAGVGSTFCWRGTMLCRDAYEISRSQYENWPWACKSAAQG